MSDYNTDINPLGSISDINVIIETIKYYNKTENLTETKDEFVIGNIFGFNITSSRKRFFYLIKKLFLKHENNKTKEFFINFISNDNPSNLFKRKLLYLEVFRENQLFQDITKELIYKKYHENRRLISSNEIFDFLLDFGEDTKVTEWSESTVKIISIKYISFMKRVGYFQDDQGRKSMIDYSYPDQKIITYLVYLLKSTDLSDNQIYNSDLFTALMLSEEDKVGLLKKGSLAGYYDFDFSGARNATFTLNFKQEEIIDELFR